MGRIVRGFKRCKDAEALGQAEAQRLGRYLSYQYDADGSLILKAQLPPELGALVLKALSSALNALPTEDEPDAPAGASTVKLPTSTPRQRRADALALMAESFLAHGNEALSGGDKHQIIVHVDAETLSNAIVQLLIRSAKTPKTKFIFAHIAGRAFGSGTCLPWRALPMGSLQITSISIFP